MLLQIKKRVEWLIESIKWICIRILHVLLKKYFINEKKYGRYKQYSLEAGNRKLRALLETKIPFACGRESYVEFSILVKHVTKKLFGIELFCFAKNVEFLTEKENSNNRVIIKRQIKKYYELMEEAIKSLDVLGIWFNLAMGDALLNYIECKESLYISPANVVEPYNYDEPWSKALFGKKVLVVSPFYKLIEYQYKNHRVDIWENKDILPEFELIAIDSVWYPSDKRFKSWFDALDYLWNQIAEIEFEVALLGCGPFSLPLASMIKKSGRQSIQCGGALQLLFGIKGKRWDESHGDTYYNEFWVRPGDDTKPEGHEKLDNDCYW